MKKLIALLLLALVGPSAQAGVSCSVPFNLQNGTTADATQVMANYNAIIACLANAAAAGANNDITSLSALSTPITPTQGGTNTYTGGTSSGSANAQTLSSVTPSVGFTLTAGKRVVFRAGFTNTDAMTFNTVSSGAVNVYRVTNVGLTPLVGGEVVTGAMVELIYDGTQYQLAGPTVLVGASVDYRGTSVPAGYLLEDGSCRSQATFAALFAVIGTTYGSCAGPGFNLPDSRGRMNAGLDSSGVRLTGAGSGCNGASIGIGCGSQSFTIAQANLPNATLTTALTSTAVTVTDPGHNHSDHETTASQASGPGAVAAGSVAGNTGTSTTGISAVLANGAGTTSSINGGITQTATVGLPPLIVSPRVIKY